jgi:predicted amidohydrolase YtcJ
MRKRPLWIAVAVLTAFGASRTLAQVTAPNLTDYHKTTFYLHGRIYTGDPKMPYAAAMGVRDEKILCIGTIEQVLLDCGGAQAEDPVQLHGKFVMPGFNDAHTHLGAAGREKLALDLRGKSLAEIQAMVKDAAAKKQPGEWILGSGWDQTTWPDKKFPNRLQLDEGASKNPVYLVHISGHVAVANSEALRHGEVTKDSPNPTGGEVERFEDGEPTGLLKENAMTLVEQRIPDPSPEERRRGIEMVLAELSKNGVTSAQDNSEWEDFDVYNDLKLEKKLNVRITEWLHFMDPLVQLETHRSQGGTDDPWLKTGALKIVTDGALGTRTAAMLAPYSDDPQNSGIMDIEPEKLKAMALERDKAGFQLAFHAIGDRANRIALDTFESLVRVNGTRERRDRVEHAQVLSPQDLPRFAQLKVIASMQPSHEMTDQRWAEARLGPERSKGAYAWNSLLKSGATLAFGTDYSVEPINPFRGLYACVTRAGADGLPAGGWEPQEKISLDECIHAYTVGSAFAEFEEKRKGTLKVGQFADFVILSQDVTKAAPADILKTEVLTTVVGGRVVYSKQ